MPVDSTKFTDMFVNSLNTRISITYQTTEICPGGGEGGQWRGGSKISWGPVLNLASLRVISILASGTPPRKFVRVSISLPEMFYLGFRNGISSILRTYFGK